MPSENTLSDQIAEQLSRIESEWFDIASADIARVIQQHANEEFYAAGFWLFYVDYSQIGPPLLYVNTESDVLLNGEDDIHRWDAANWQLKITVDTSATMSARYMELSELLQGQPAALWDFADESSKQLIARVFRWLTESIRHERPPFDSCDVCPWFVAGIFDGRDGWKEANRLVRASITAELIEELGIPMLPED